MEVASSQTDRAALCAGKSLEELRCLLIAGCITADDARREMLLPGLADKEFRFCTAGRDVQNMSVLDYEIHALKFLIEFRKDWRSWVVPLEEFHRRQRIQAALDQHGISRVSPEFILDVIGFAGLKIVEG